MRATISFLMLLLAASLSAGFKPAVSPNYLPQRRTSPVDVINNRRCCDHRLPLTVSMSTDSETLVKNDDEREQQEPIYRRLVPQARRPSTEGGLRYRSDDWIVNVLSIPRSYLLRRIKFHLLFDQMMCILVMVLRNRFGWKRLTIPILGHELLGSFLGLLLVFRTNSAYQRFQEARDYWTQVSTLCRTLALESVSHIRPYAPNSAERFEQLLLAFPDILAYTCLAGNTKARLPPFEWKLLYGEVELTNTEKPQIIVPQETVGATEIVDELVIDPATVILHKMHRVLYEASCEYKTSQKQLFNLHLHSMGDKVNALSDALSGCEKIVGTPVPLSYSRHTSRFLTLWCSFLPFSIVPIYGWVSLPFMAAASWLLYGLEEIGHLIEQPFVPVTDKPSYLISDDVIDDDRASKTQPYDIGLPICSVAEKVRMEVEKIISIQGSNK